MEEKITWKILRSKLGNLIGGTTSKGCCLLEFVDRRSLNTIISKMEQRYKMHFVHGTSSILEKLQEELNEYFDGSRNQFSVPLDVRGTPFQMSVWSQLLSIPYGETRSYNDIAKSIKNETAVRAVGRANGDNNIGIVIPCHRVIASDGNLQGYGGGLWRKKELLTLEESFKSNFSQNSRSIPDPTTLDNWLYH
ncbi:MAG: methylated-DNA--[protein]-cysteine S-methyltransferase [Candidatus Heimdallarchaeota archaeon]